MITYKNQKVVQIHSEPHDKEHTYGVISRSAMSTASRVLKDGTAFTMYIYMAMNQNGFQLALSPKAVEAEIGLSDKQYRRAIKMLIDHGFLVQVKDGSCHYHFYEWPVIYKGAISTGIDTPIKQLPRGKNIPIAPVMDIQFAPAKTLPVSTAVNRLSLCGEPRYAPPKEEPIPPEGTEIVQGIQDIQNKTIDNISFSVQKDVSSVNPSFSEEFPIEKSLEEDELLKELLGEEYQEAENPHDWQIVIYEDEGINYITALCGAPTDDHYIIGDNDLPF